MKKIFLSLIIFAVLLFPAICREKVCASEIYYCDFENMAELGEEWYQLGPAAASKISVAADPKDKTNSCLKIERQISYETSYATSAVLRLNGRISDDFSMQLRVYTDSSLKWYVPADLYGNMNDREYEVSRLHLTRASQITANEYPNQGSYSCGEWHDILLKFDFKNARTTFYMDNKKIGTYKNLVAAEDIRRICFRTYDNNSVLYIDDIKLRSYDGLSVRNYSIHRINDNIFGTIYMLNDGINPENISVISALRNGGVLTEQSADSINIPVGDYQYELSLKSENGLSEKTDLELFFWNAEDKNLIPAANKLFVSSEEMNVILISDYGATPNDGIDDGDAIFSALEAANAAGGKTTVLFDEGEYLLSSGDYSSTTHAISLENAENIELQGNDTVLKMKNSFLGVFAFKNCSNISINGIDFDYETLPWAQGKAESINRENGSFIFCTDEETGKILSDERASASIGFGMIMNSENPHILKGNASNYFFIKKYEKTEPNKYRIYLSDDNKNMLENEIALDDNIIINCRKGTKAIFSLNGCGEFSIKNCNVYASCGTDITALNHNGDLNINGLKNIRKNSRWIVTNADGLHIQGIRGKLNVTNSVFDGNSDDCVNIYQKPAYVSEVSSDNKITVYKGTQIPKTGDTVIIANPITGKIKGKSKVVSSEYRQGSSYYVNIGLEDEISEIVSGTDVKNADNVFIEELGGDAVNITNCEFLNSRRYGLLLRSRNTTVQNCNFENLYSSALVISNDFSIFSEGPGSHNVIFSENTVKNCAYSDLDKMNHGAVIIESNSINGDSEGKFHSQISIKNNDISTCAKYIVYICGASGVDLTGNNLTNAADKISSQNACSVFADKSDNLIIKENVITDMRLDLKTSLVIGENTKDTIAEDNIFNLSNNSAAELLY